MCQPVQDWPSDSRAVMRQVGGSIFEKPGIIVPLKSSEGRRHEVIGRCQFQ
jgi:hypothetical protein